MTQAALLVELVRQLEESQWLPPDELSRRQHRQLIAVARHAAGSSPLFADRLRRARLTPGDLGTPAGLSRLPPLTRREFQRAGTGAFCADVPPTHLPLSEYASSGSTGEPVTLRRTALNRIDWLALTMRMHLWFGSGPGMRFCAIRATLLGISERANWGEPAQLFFATGPMLGIPNDIAIARQAELVAAFRPDILLTNPSNLAGLIREIKAGAPHFPLRQIRTIAEALPDPLRAEAQAMWGTTPIDCYSADEVGYIALQCPASGLYHLMAEMLLVEIVDADGHPTPPGEVGRVLITDLRNFATPMIRYELGDHAVAGRPCPCGRGLPTIGRIMGRERNLILMPDGSRHWPHTGQAGYRGVAPITQYQMIQVDRERIEVRLVVERPLIPAEEAALKEVMRKELGHPFAIDFAYFPDTLPKGPNGKLEEFICRVEAERGI